MGWAQALADRPRAPLMSRPSPLHPAPRLSAALGVDLWLKRDDVGSIGLAGNKARKLELTLGAALAEGADCVVTVGAAQSNHCRATAAAAAALGLEAHLLLRGDAPAGPPTGNLLLDRLFGARVHVAGVEDWAGLAAALDALAARLRDEGRRPLVLPAGGSTPLGALGFVAAYGELLDQLDAAGVEAAHLFHASTSGGTHAGLALGHALHGRGPAPVGLEVGRLYDDVPAAVARIANEAAALLGAGVRLDPAALALPDDQIGAGYGAFTGAAAEAIALAGRLEGLVFDPVYSGKALAGVVARARAGELDGPVVLWHTGGAPSIFAAGFADGALRA
ncbi:MAG: pyridoxal-phosphate dependent enzyme [Solirubrobacteraceae bacterium]|nr:pyridoxal-phosphate dependent enzyme [Solirubrobacteraceae bacterium]